MILLYRIWNRFHIVKCHFAKMTFVRKNMTFVILVYAAVLFSDLIGNKKESRLFSAFYFSLNARQGTVNLLILHSILNQIVHPVHRMTVHFQTDVNDRAIHHVV